VQVSKMYKALNTLKSNIQNKKTYYRIATPVTQILRLRRRRRWSWIVVAATFSL